MASLFNIVVVMTTVVVMSTNGAKKLPSGVSQHQYCHGCIAVVEQLIKKVPASLKKGRDLAIVEAMEKICTNANFVTYQYSPPKTVKACNALMEDHEEDIETALRRNVEAIDKLICHEISGACNGVDLSNKNTKFSDIDLTKDGQEDGSGAKSVKIDPSSGKVVKEAKAKSEGKTLSKADKKKKTKKTKKSKKGDGKKSKEAAKPKPGTKKGAIHNLNIDINDPSSIQRVMDQINSIKQKHGDDDAKDEL
jgi:hypothetical protein